MLFPLTREHLAVHNAHLSPPGRPPLDRFLCAQLPPLLLHMARRLLAAARDRAQTHGAADALAHDAKLLLSTAMPLPSLSAAVHEQ